MVRTTEQSHLRVCFSIYSNRYIVFQRRIGYTLRSGLGTCAAMIRYVHCMTGQTPEGNPQWFEFFSFSGRWLPGWDSPKAPDFLKMYFQGETIHKSPETIYKSPETIFKIAESICKTFKVPIAPVIFSLGRLMSKWACWMGAWLSIPETFRRHAEATVIKFFKPGLVLYEHTPNNTPQTPKGQDGR